MSKTKDTYNLIWFTTNLRVVDNEVLNKALASQNPVIACYCFDPRHFEKTKYGFKKTQRYRAKFLIETVKDLKKNLDLLNIPLLTFTENPELAISRLLGKYQIENIFVQKEFTKEENTVIRNVQKKLNTTNLVQIYDQFLYNPHDVLRTLNKIPNVFTTFRKHLEKNLIIPQYVKPKAQKLLKLNNSTIIPNLEDFGFDEFHANPNSAFPFNGGETQAKQRLNYYLFESKKIGVYKKTRNGLVGTDYSSKFSPWLANGSISARTIYWAIKEFEEIYFKNQSTYWLIFELLWRDFFKFIALQQGNDIFKIHGILNKNYNWNRDKDLINKWQNGQTANSFVNANMIELNKTGWMSNRGRQNVASYFAKTLKLDWRIGAAYFESLLIDYDVHSNYGNWMYVAGVGNDPRDRVFNVELQAQRYDPNHKFQNLWLQTTLFE